MVVGAGDVAGFLSTSQRQLPLRSWHALCEVETVGPAAQAEPGFVGARMYVRFMTSTSAFVASDGDVGVAGELAGVLARLGELTDAAIADATEGDRDVDAARIDQITLLERIQAAAAATQAAVMVAFGRSQVAAQEQAVRADPRAVGRGIGDQIALACHVSPWEGSRRLRVARALFAGQGGKPAELPATAALLRDGRVSAYVAGIVVTETRHLDPGQRRAVDQQLAGGSADPAGADGLAGCAPRRAALLARKYAYAADPKGYIERGRTARTDRRVSLRPAPDTMTLLTGFLPLEQGVACLAALRRHTDAVKTSGDSRSRAQIMADTLVERVTGQATAADVQAEVAIVIPVQALTHPEQGSGQVAEVVGHGPIPAALAKEILAGSEGRKWWRRLFTAHHGGVVGGDPTRRCFDGTLAKLIAYRDGSRCREPFCDAPARETDHIVPFRDGGPTTFTNGRAVCVRSNRVREMPGWAVRLVHDGLGDQPHTVATTTPTGLTYTSRAGPAP